MVRRQAPSKGIILLIVVSLLALFVLIGVTYVLVGSQYRRAATMASRTTLLQIDPQMQLDRALYQVVRDTMNTNSDVRGEGLLLDMYGRPLPRRTVTAALLLANNQYLDLQVAGGALPDVHGRVLTFLSGPLKNHSTRIVSMPAATTIRVVMPIVERIDLSLSPLVPLPVAAIQAGNYQVLINGPAFWQVNPGDPNEDYDAVDRNNMALAALIPSKSSPDEIEHVIPSYYRPTFAELDKTQPGYIPLPVDNDGDGVPDSGWVDMGFPVQTDASGRRYRPYFAVLCLDMDGRLNLNAHGSLMQAMRENGINSSIPMQDATTPNVPGTTTILLPKGQGYGPAEINLMGRSRGPDGEWGRAGIDDDNNGLIDDWRERFFPNKGLDGEWGQAGTDDDMNGTTDDISEYLWPGSDDTDDRFIFSAGEYSNLLVGEHWKAATPTALPGIPGRYGANDLPGRFLYDTLSPFKFFEYPDNYFNNTNGFSSYRSLSDLNGELAIGISHLGQPVYERPRLVINIGTTTMTRQDAKADNPYEFNLAETKSSDNRFTVAELERVLRSYDVDSDSLPDRLTRLIPRLSHQLNPNNVPSGARFGEASRRAITTDSYDLPVRPALTGDLAWPSLLWSQLSVDLKSGRRLDVNQAFPSFSPADPERQAYIRSLYLLAMALKGRDIDFDGLMGFDDTNGMGVDPVRDNAYGLAQWAVNVVDFRDSDSIMTAYEFDLRPFNGDPVNGFDGILGSADDNHPDRGLVWGCERPELLITETVAWHDRATEDLITADKKVDDVDNPDEDFDQRLMPRSGFFVELYNPWKGDDDLAGNGMQLDLKDVATGESPVWQLVVVRGPTKERDLDDPNPAQRPTANHIERCIYFTNPPGAVGPFISYPNVESWYQDIGKNIRVLPGHYAVIGSRGQEQVIDGQTNYFSYLGRTMNHNDGYIDDGSDIPTMPSYDNAIAVDEYAVTRQVQLVPGTSELFVNVNSRPGSANLNLKPTVALPINRRLYPSDGTAMDQPGSLTITEPVGGYLDMNYNVVPGPQGEMWLDGVGDDGAFSPPLDRPLDEKITDNQGSGLNRGDLDQNGTIRDYAVVHLRRLANHLLPYHPTTNPYRTIDSMSVDVTRFNGADGSDDPLAGNDPVRFHGLQRGDRSPHDRNIWRHEKKTRDAAVNDPIPAATSHHFNYDLIHSLGYLNDEYLDFYPGVPAAAVDDSLKGEPMPTGPDGNRKPFPWLTWFNRPFVSQYDLMLVPHSRSSRLLIDFSLKRPDANPYVVPFIDVPQVENDQPSSDLAHWPFAHLINFFERETGGSPGFDLHKIFDYTYVPSRFLGTAHWLNPVKNLPNPRPVNRHLLFREPGKLNINTIFDPAIWDAYLDGHEGPRFWGNSITGIVDSRRGFGIRGGPMLQPNPADPGNFFTTPFRRTKPNDQGIIRGILRHDVIPPIVNQQPLFETYPSLQTAAAGVSHDNARDATRNAYFYYQGIQRMGNLITTRSNVYAIWITVGFFEFDPVTGNRLGEVGFETGEIDRHRAFYMFDRSIPVACEPGKNHNVDQAIVLRRYLE